MTESIWLLASEPGGKVEKGSMTRFRRIFPGIKKIPKVTAHVKFDMMCPFASETG
jgi:hypothetical protein